jgi:hypothetical protein
MASHISPDSALSRSRALRRALIAALVLAAPLAAQALHDAPADAGTAQVYVWRDAGGTVRFSPAPR